jgi:uncharacterized membrane protein
VATLSTTITTRHGAKIHVTDGWRRMKKMTIVNYITGNLVVPKYYAPTGSTDVGAVWTGL